MRPSTNSPPDVSPANAAFQHPRNANLFTQSVVRSEDVTPSEINNNRPYHTIPKLQGTEMGYWHYTPREALFGKTGLDRATYNIVHFLLV